MDSTCGSQLRIWLFLVSVQLSFQLSQRHDCTITRQRRNIEAFFDCNQGLVMAALHSRCEHHIFDLLVSSFLESFFPRLFSAVAYWMSTIRGVCVMRSINFLLTYLLTYYHTSTHENTGSKKSPKIRHLRTIAQLCRAISSQLRHVSTIGKKLVKQQYLLHISPQYGKLRPTNGWDRFTSLGHPSKFQWVLRLAFVTATTSLIGGQPNFARCLAISWAGTLYIHFRRLLPRQNFSWYKIHFTSKSCILLYWQRYPILAAFCRALQQWASAKLCGMVQGMELKDFHRGRHHLYSAGRPSRWASAHILVG